MILTGFLGSGKTTLLSSALGHAVTGQATSPHSPLTPAVTSPVLADAALLINEVGAVGIDQRLVGGLAATAPLLLAGGCVCCNVRGDLAAALEDLYWQRLERRVPRFERVVIETTGLAHPLPLIETIDREGIVAERYRLAAVICTIDARQGLQQLERHPECRAQVALADRLLITRSDLATPEVIEALRERLAALNPFASMRVHSVTMPVDPLLFSDVVDFCRDFDTDPPVSERAGPALGFGRPISPVGPGRAFAHAAIDTLVVRVADGVTVARVEQALARLLEVHGEGILRVKGIIACDTGSIVFQVAAGVCSPPRQAHAERVAEVEPADHSIDASRAGEPSAAIGSLDSELVIIVTGVRRSAVLATLEAALPGQVTIARGEDARR
jgi:G3E family GTPase